MSNYIIAFVLILLLPSSANASNMGALNSWLTVAYTFYILVPALLIHLIATVYFHKQGYYRSDSFTAKHVVTIMLVPIVGITLIIFEYLTHMGQSGIHVGTFLSIIFVYVFLSLLFAIPYLLHLTAFEEQ